jgi:class 3 adenylate cyclase/tetratricopeptide (TPR) repeat protein
MSELRPRAQMPEELAAKLRDARASRRMRGERRVITMLFCDVTGSTAMAEDLDPEDWAEIMDEAFNYMVAPIYHYEGTLARMMGDGFLAFFGAPIAHEDDPRRAVLAGLDIIHELRPFREQIEREYALDFNVRVGINTGPVVVGDIGSDLHLEYTAMGDAINLASRMEETAEPGTVQLAESTHRLVAPLFDFESLGRIAVKGKGEPVAAYRALGQKRSPGRIRGIEGLESPLVGRSHEFEALRDDLKSLEGGRGRIVFIVGEAGLGKSRLISELKSEWRELVTDESKWLQSQAVPYERTRPYSLFERPVRDALGIELDDPPALKRERIAAGLDTFPEERRELLFQALAALLVRDDVVEGPQIKGEALKRALHELMLYECESNVSGGPFVYVFDDLHWADPASSELITSILTLAERYPVMFLAAMRPHRETPGWQVRAGAAETYPEQYREINLEPLTESDSEAMIANLLTISELPGRLRKIILEKAEGNPFFVEEVVRSLIEMGAVVRDEAGARWRAGGPVDDIAIPDNLQALLISRMDRLEKEAKRTLQLASVIGRTFYERILGYINDKVSDLSQQLDNLQQAELILLAAQAPELAYRFRHELTRDAAYGTILRRERRAYHRRVGQAIEELLPERMGELVLELANHFGEAGEKEKALKYFQMAAEASARVWANAEAAEQYGQAIKNGRSVAANERLAQLYLARGRVLEHDGRYDEAIAGYEELEAHGREREERKLVLAAIVALARVQATPNVHYDPAEAQELADRALELARELGDYAAEAKVYWILMILGRNERSDYEKSVAYGERSLAIAREHALREQMAYTLHDLARPYLAIQNYEWAVKSSEEAGRLFREQGDLPMLADNLATQAIGQGYLGQLDRAIALSEEALELSRRTGNSWGQSYALAVGANLYFERGQVDWAMISARESLSLGEEASFAGAYYLRVNFLAEAYVRLGHYTLGLETAQTMLDGGLSSRAADIAPMVQLAKATAYLEMGDVAAAGVMLEQLKKIDPYFLPDPRFSAMLFLARLKYNLAAGSLEETAAQAASKVEELRKLNYMLWLPDLLHIRGRALMALGKIEEAETVLKEGASIAREMGSLVRLWPILATLTALEAGRGDEEQAAAFRTEARQAIDFISDHIGDDELRAHFLAMAGGR